MPAEKPLLLHACCGPCSLEPVRVLREQGFLPHIVYVNPNIEPLEEYERRLQTLHCWAAGQGIQVSEGPYEPDRWEREVAVWGTNRPVRCAMCYRLRLETAAQMASELGYGSLSTTLAVSPYQLFEACGNALSKVCSEQGLETVWEDFRPLYPEATKIAKELGMYRQGYCGCRFSAAEAAAQRCEARRERTLARDIERSIKVASLANRDISSAKSPFVGLERQQVNESL